LPFSLILFIFYLINIIRRWDSFKYVNDVLVKYSIRILTAIRISLTAKIFRVLEVLVLLHYLVAPAKIKYLIVTPGTAIPPELLLVTGLLILRLKTKVQWLGFWLNSRLKFDVYVKY